MNILFAIKSLSNRSGGAERVLTDVCNGFAERGHVVSVLTYDDPQAVPFYRFHPSINVINLGIGRPGQRARLVETFWRMLALRNFIVKARPDIVVGFMNSIFTPLGIALLGTAIPVIASEHALVEYYQGRPFERLLLQLTPCLTRRTIVVSEKIREKFGSLLRRHMVVIPNPVSWQGANSFESAAPDSTQQTILSVGRLSPEKCHRTLIDAFSMLAADFPTWNLRIVGAGELRGDLETQIAKLHLQDRITLVGATQDISKEYQRAELFVMSSVFESFGLATAEALAHGLPVIGFADCPGTNELIINEYNGILVEGACREQVLADGMRRLIGAPELRQKLGRAGPDSVAQYSLGRICDKWEALLGMYVQRIAHSSSS